MGSKMSVNSSKTVTAEIFELSQGEHCKRQRMTPTSYEENPRLIPSLPDELSIQILARIPRIHYLKMKLISRAWKFAIVSTELFDVRKELGTTEEWLYLLTKANNERFLWHALDPMSRKWQKLPLMPGVAIEEEPRKGLRMWNMVKGIIGKKLSGNSLPFNGCAVGAIDGFLYILGGLSKDSASRRVWKYDPVLNAWTETSPMCVGRAFCKTAVLKKKLYVVGGVMRGPGAGGLTSLQSAEVFDPNSSSWSIIPSMPFVKAQVLPTAFLADLLKPIATGITSYRGKLFVSQSLYCWPFFVDIGGEVYDPEADSWCEMPAGMADGWPVKQAGTKLSVAIDGELYALEPSSNLDSARIKVYDRENDTWNSFFGEIPVFDFENAESSYLLAGLVGKLHVVTKDSGNNIRVLQVDVENRLIELSERRWEVIATWNTCSADLVSCQTLDL